MSSSPALLPVGPDPGRALTEGPAEGRHARLERTATFRNGRLPRWLAARAFVIGAGNLGGRVALEVARSGSRVVVCDKDLGAEVNLATQCVQVGVSKAHAVAAACNALAPGSTQAIHADVRSLGAGALLACDVLLDCSDDAELAWPLTMLSNGLDIPLLRLALDGSGRTEVGRVLTSAGGAGHACQLCPLGLADLARPARATPCPGGVPGAPAPTAAGGAIGMAIAGLGVLQAQRLVTGNDREQVLDRELLLDLTHAQLLATRLSRSQACLGRHERWGLVSIGLALDVATFADVFELCARHLDAGAPDDLVLEPCGHPLALLAQCACGASRPALGSVWSEGPACRRCGRAMHWRRDVEWPRFGLAQARELGILARTPGSLGLPADGALLIARAPGRPALGLLLDPRPAPQAPCPTQPTLPR